MPVAHKLRIKGIVCRVVVHEVCAVMNVVRRITSTHNLMRL